MAAVVGGDDPMARGERLELPGPVVRVAGPAVDEEDRRSLALVGVEELEIIERGKRHGWRLLSPGARSRSPCRRRHVGLDPLDVVLPEGEVLAATDAPSGLRADEVVVVPEATHEDRTGLQNDAGDDEGLGGRGI